MSLIKYYSPLEERDFPDTFFIGYYGITVSGIEEELKNAKDELTAFSYLIKKRDRLILVNQNLDQYSFKRFYDFSSFEWLEEEIIDTDIEKKESFPEAKARYNAFIKSINLNELIDPIIKIIIEDIKNGRSNIDILSIQNELFNFIKWLDNVIRKLSVVIDISNYQDIDETNLNDEKIVWLKKKEDFVALFDKLFELGFFAYSKNKHQLLSKHFIWPKEEMDSGKLKHLKNNIKNKPETHQISEELKNLKFD